MGLQMCFGILIIIVKTNFFFNGPKGMSAVLLQNTYIWTLNKRTCIIEITAVYHIKLQTAIMEIHGYDCMDNEYFDKRNNKAV